MWYKLALIGVIAGYSSILQADQRLTFTTGLDYSSGSYGQTTKTRILYVPFIAKYELSERWSLKAVVPWLQIEGPGGVSADSRITTGNTIFSRKTTESGLGDVVLGTTYSALQSEANHFYIDIGAKVKIPTASESKGLGTGKTDYTLSTDLYKTVDKLTFLGSVGYRVLGDPSGVKLNNVWFSTIGGVYKFDTQNSAGLTLDLRQATSNSSTSLREYSAFYSHKFNDTYKLQTYMVVGDTTSSVDFGAGAMLAITW